MTKPHKRWVSWTILMLSAGLIIGGFLTPPIGTIDGSVLTAIGELLGFKALDELPDLVKKHGSAKVQVGSTSIEVGNDEEK